MPRDPTSLSLRSDRSGCGSSRCSTARAASSRTDLARWTGLSRATVSTLVEELGHAGVVEEHEAASTHGPRPTGRPPVLLSLVPGAAFAVGLDFGHQHLRVAICDLSGELVAEDWLFAEVDHAPIESLDLARELVLASLRGAGIAPDRLLGVGMGLAAPIYRANGRHRGRRHLPGWQGIRPAAEMEARLGVPVELENDANVGALGEKVFGAARGVDDLVYVRVSAGIGAGLILGGRPYRGFRGVAGEFGHVLADPTGPICRCGNRGCLGNDRQPGGGGRAARAQHGHAGAGGQPARARRGRRPRRAPRGGRRGRGDRARAVDAGQCPRPRARRRRGRPGAGRDGPPRSHPGGDRASRRGARRVCGARDRRHPG